MQKVDIEDIPFGHFRLWALKFVNRGMIPDHVDECTLRAAILKVPLRLLKFVFWDMWVALAEESGALVVAILSFLGGATLIGIFWALFVIDTDILLVTLLAIALIFGAILVLLVVALCIAFIAESDGAKRLAYRVVDSTPTKATGSFARVVWSIVKWLLMPIKWLAYDLVWVKLLGESENKAANVFVIIVAALFAGAILFLLVLNLIVNTVITLIILGVGFGVLLIVGLVVLFFVAGWFEAIKERVCRPVDIIE